MKTFAESQPEPAMTLEEAVWIDPGRMSGTPCFRGTRLPVQQLFDWLADGVPLDESSGISRSTPVRLPPSYESGAPPSRRLQHKTPPAPISPDDLGT